jgi:hypothetical protein
MLGFGFMLCALRQAFDVFSLKGWRGHVFLLLKRTKEAIADDGTGQTG